MKASLKKLGVLALLLGCLALALGSTGCSGHEQWRRPGWIIPNR